MTTLVIGAGMAGATCARALADAGEAVLVVDKGRAAGGRLAQRRTDSAVFDHGAQYMAVRDPAFAAAVAAWRERGLVAGWAPRGGPVKDADVVIGTPTMAAPVKALLDGIELVTGTRVTALAREPAGWRVTSDQGDLAGRFERVVLALPAPQATALLGAHPFAARLDSEVAYAPCLSAMVSFAVPVAAPIDLVQDRDADLVWACRNASRPGRAAPHDAWTLHASPGWSQRRLEDPPETWASELVAMLERHLGELPPIAALAGHRWRYALVTRALGEACQWDAPAALGVCGEWCIAGRIEAAFLSGRAMAQRILARSGGAQG